MRKLFKNKNLLFFLFLFILVSNIPYTKESEEMLNVVILLGPPGSGKGTQAKRLSRELHIPHISTGDLFRENISNKTEIGLKAKELMAAGKYVPDEIVFDMLFNRLSAPDCTNGFLLDGYPRTLHQAEVLEKKFSSLAHFHVLVLDVSDEEIVKRISGRLSCRGCPQIYHQDFAKPKEDGKCDSCRASLYIREDDKPEVVKERLKQYHLQTQPVVDFYKNKMILKSVNGHLNPDEVFLQLKNEMARK